MGKILKIIISISTIGLHLWALLRFPTLFVDEVWQMSRAWGFVQTGQTFGMLDMGVANRYPGYWTFLPWLSNTFQGYALLFSGEPSIFAIRIVSLLFGLLLLLAVYIIARRFGGDKAAWITIAITAYTFSFWNTSHQARYDIMVSAFGFSALALYFIDEAYPRWWIRVLCGLIATLVIEVHAFGIIYIVPLIAMYLWRYGWKIIKQRQAWQVLLGGIIGVIFYISIHILPYPDSYFALNQLYFGSSHTIPLLTFNPVTIIGEFFKTFGNLYENYLLAFPLILIMIFWMAYRKNHDSKLYLILLGSLFITFVLLLHNKFIYYDIFITPAFDIGLGCFIFNLWNQVKQRYSKPIQSGLLVFLIFIFSLNSIFIVRFSFGNSLSHYYILQEKVNSFVQPGDVVMGTQIYWYGLTDHTYYTWEQLIYYQRYDTNADLQAAIVEFKPDIFLIDNHMKAFMREGPLEHSLFTALHIPKDELYTFLSKNATLLGTLNGDVYGDVEVYRIKWPNK